MEGNFEVPSRQFSSGMSIPITGEMEFGLAETHSMISVPPGMEGSSFTALLELPTLQVMDLLIEDEFPAKPIPPPTLPSDIALVDRSSRLSIYTSVNNSPEPESTTILSASNSMKLDFVSSSPPVSNPSSKSRKRKETVKKVKEPNRKSKKVVTNEASEESGEKLPYVHVRARRGQATDSHSLAERARREKINARMKLLQELVPGCNKVSGTAIVLDEIINHVQALQRQVEFLSMRLAAVNPRVDFNLDALLVAENGSSMDSSYPGMFDPPVWPEGSINMNRQHQHHQTLHVDGLHQPSWATEEDTSNLVTQDHLLPGYDFRANSAPMEMDPNQLNMGL